MSGPTSCFSSVILRNFVTEFVFLGDLYEVFLGSRLASGGFGASFIHMIATCGQLLIRSEIESVLVVSRWRAKLHIFHIKTQSE